MSVHWRAVILYSKTSEETISTYTYKGAGVDIDAGAALVKAIKPLARATARAGSEAALGGFSAMFDLAAAGFRDPVLVATTDGVGTKLKVAAAVARHDTVGIDVVAMCVNDLLTHGAEPLFFLDYFATGKLDVSAARTVISGIAAGCREAGCALIGGETAEMPGMYGTGEYDLAGFAVGAAERGQILTGESIAAGDMILGLASNGLHSNGFSLVRRIVADKGLSYSGRAPFAPRQTLGEALLRPTRIYVKSGLAAVRAGRVRALAHITGGGLIDNISRVLPDGLKAEIDGASWPPPPVFRWLAAACRIDSQELARTFNCGIGMAVITAPDDVAEAESILAAAGEKVHRIGRIVPRPEGAPACEVSGLEARWCG